jgi:hypothetical protein
MIHQQSKIFYRSGAGKLKRSRGYSQCFITDIFLVFLLHSCRISYSAGEPFVRGQMVHQQIKIFYRCRAGKLKRCQ